MMLGTFLSERSFQSKTDHHWEYGVKNKKLRIAHVQPIALDIFGHRDEDWGTKVQYFLTNIAFTQARLGDQPAVHLLTSGKPKQMELSGVRVHFHSCWQFPTSWPVTARFARQFSFSMIKAIRKDEADVIHFHGARSLHLMHGVIAWKAHIEGIPLLSQDHGPRRGRWIEESFRKYGSRRTDVFLAANEDSLSEFRSTGYLRNKGYIAPNGFDPKLFYPTERSLRHTDAPFKILVVSRLWEEKDPFTMAEAVCRFAQAPHRVELTVIGQGVLRSQIEERLFRAEVPVTFKEHLSHQEIADLYRSHDVLLLTSLREGWNQVTIEAMACGLPVVASDIPGIRDGVCDAGILVPPAMPDLFAEALTKIASNPSIALEYRNRGLARSRRFTWDALMLRLRRIYLTQLDSSRDCDAQTHDEAEALEFI